MLWPGCLNISRPMMVFDLLCLNITFVYLVIAHFLMCLLIYIWILLFLIVGHSQFHLNEERSGKGKVMFILSVHFSFVSHSTDQSVVMVSSCASYLILVMLLTYHLSLVMLNLRLIYMWRRGVSWLILVKLVRPVCSPIQRLVICFTVGLTFQT